MEIRISIDEWGSGESASHVADWAKAEKRIDIMRGEVAGRFFLSGRVALLHADGRYANLLSLPQLRGVFMLA
jgi:hypothetical protein